MRKGHAYMEGEFYNTVNPLVGTNVRIEREGKRYEGKVIKERQRFYLSYNGKLIRIRPTDIIKPGKLEKKIK